MLRKKVPSIFSHHIIVTFPHFRAFLGCLPHQSHHFFTTLKLVNNNIFGFSFSPITMHHLGDNLLTYKVNLIRLLIFRLNKIISKDTFRYFLFLSSFLTFLSNEFHYLQRTLLYVLINIKNTAFLLTFSDYLLTTRTPFLQTHQKQRQIASSDLVLHKFLALQHKLLSYNNAIIFSLLVFIPQQPLIIDKLLQLPPSPQNLIQKHRNITNIGTSVNSQQCALHQNNHSFPLHFQRNLSQLRLKMSPRPATTPHRRTGL